MKINEIIRECRLAKGLTQEQLATFLGVTAPAVNKWEKGTSYPDITLLPTLARVLDTDLNTLLSFKEDLTEREIALFLNHLSELLDANGYESAYEAAMDKIKEFPTCYALILNVALSLDGALVLHPKMKHRERYEKAVEELYHRALESQDTAIRNRAKSMLISKLMERKEYEKAQTLLETLPDRETVVDKRQMQAQLYLMQGQLEEAAKIEEEKLLSATNELHQILITLMEIALRDNRMEDAEYIANVSKEGTQLFDLWEYTSYVAHLQLYSACKNRRKCLQTLLPMLKALRKKWDINASPLYRHIQTKKVDKAFGPKMQKAILDSIRTDQDAAFLREDAAFQSLEKEFDFSEDREEA